MKRRFLRGDSLIEVLLATAIFSIAAVSVIGAMRHGINTAETSLESTMALNEISSQAEALRFIQESHLADPSDAYYDALWNAIMARANSPYVGVSSEVNTSLTANKDYPSAAAPYDASDTTNYIASSKPFVINIRALADGDSKYRAATAASAREALVNSIVIPFSQSKFSRAAVYPRLIYSKTGDSSQKSDSEILADSTVASDYTTLSSAEGIWVVAVMDEATPDSASFVDFYIRTCWSPSGAQVPSTISTTIRLSNPGAMASFSSPTINLTLAYNANGGSGAPASQSSGTISVTRYTFTISSTRPTRSGYTFKGWATSSVATTAGYQPGGSITISSNTTLYAVWQRTYNFTLSYDANGGSGAPGSQSSGTITASSYTFTISSTRPTRSGYTFKGWATSSVATTAGYQPGGSITISSNTTLYAVWQRTYNFTLSYDANGGSGAPGSQSSGTITASSHTFTISSTRPTRSGYNFKGWATSSVATTAGYQPGGQITISSDTTLYAVWQKNETTLQNWTGCPSLASKTTVSVKDSRDGQYYRVAKLRDGHCYMVDNLNLGATDISVDLDSSNTHITGTISASTFNSWRRVKSGYPVTSNMFSSSYTQGQFVSVPGEDPNTYTNYGTLYNYCAATGGKICMEPINTYTGGYTTPVNSDLCPAGWRLPTFTNRHSPAGELDLIGDYYKVAGDPSSWAWNYWDSSGKWHGRMWSVAPISVDGMAYAHAGYTSGNSIGSVGHYWLETLLSGTGGSGSHYTSTEYNFNNDTGSWTPGANTMDHRSGLSIRCIQNY